jgi:hypothetical protein
LPGSTRFLLFRQEKVKIEEAILAPASLRCATGKTADWVIDMGPEGGAGGGTVVGVGTPEDIAAIPASQTGHYLQRLLHD